jgi:glycosyltransferase involved in cell wall biosynthesis
MQRKIVALVDTLWMGHHPTYFKLLTKNFLEIGCEVWAFCPNIDDLRSYAGQEIHGECQARLQIFQMPLIGHSRIYVTEDGPVKYLKRPIRDTLTYWLTTAAAIDSISGLRNKKPDLVFLAKLEGWLQGFMPAWLVEKIFRYDWTGIYMCPYQFYSSRRVHLPIIKPERTLSAKNCRVITMLDEEMTKKLSAVLKKPVLHFPDITDEAPPILNHPILEKIKEKARGRKIIGLIGGLSPRKGLKTFVEVASKATDKFFLLAGRFAEAIDEETEEILKQAQKLENCLLHYQRIPDGEEFNAFINLCDIIFAAYIDFKYSSNIMTKAALFKKPIIVSEGGLMAARVRRFKTGVVIEQENTEQCLAAIELLCKGRMDISNSGFDEYFQHHAVARLPKLLNELLQYN